MIAYVVIDPVQAVLAAGTNRNFSYFGEGNLAEINGVAPTWQNLVGCAVQADGALKDTASGSGWGLAGATSTQTIAAGDGYVEFLAAVPPADPLTTYPDFGGRQLMAGLTTLASVNTDTQLDFALQVYEGGVKVWEAGIERGNFARARNGGLYRIAIENGQIVYRADGAVLYRSTQTITYPLRFGVAFLNHGSDQIGGVINAGTTFTIKAYNEAGAESGSWLSNLWTSPTVRGRYRIRARTSQDVFGYADALVQLSFPRWTGVSPEIRCPSKFLQLPDEWRVNEQEFDDLAADYNLPAQFDQPLKRWRLEWNHLAKAHCDVLDAFYLNNRSRAHAFFFYDPRANVSYDNVRITRFERNHRNVKYQSRILELTRRPL